MHPKLSRTPTPTLTLPSLTYQADEAERSRQYERLVVGQVRAAAQLRAQATVTACSSSRSS